jgi:hypothetical protein
MMGTCVVLFVLAWAVVRIWSVPAAIAMCLVAMVIPPAAAIVANRRGPEDRWWDETPGPPQRRDQGGPGGGPGGPRGGGGGGGSGSGGTHGPDTPRRSGGGRHGKRAAPAPFGDTGDPESDAWWAELDRGRTDNKHPRRPPQGGSGGS